MNLKFLVDESTGIKIVEELRRSNFNAIYIGDVARGTEDEKIIQMSLDEERILITNDKELTKIAMSRKVRAVILLRLRDERNANKVLALRKVIQFYGDKLENKLFVVTERKIRIRVLR